ncbi:hypothetical protein ACOMHN_063315 [Nucella lapillus]
MAEAMESKSVVVQSSSSSEAVLIDAEEAKQYGVEIPMEEDFEWVPPEVNHDLTDLQNLLRTLEEGTSDLDARQQPPSLFARSEHVPNYEKISDPLAWATDALSIPWRGILGYEKISELRQELETEEVAGYLSEFEREVEPDVVMLGAISLQEVQEEERRLREEHVGYLQQEALAKRRREQVLMQQEEGVKERLAAHLRQRRQEIAQREELLRQREKLLMERLHRGFRKAESQLVSALEDRKGEVKTFYGDLMTSEGQYGGSRGRRWKVDWNRTPQPIQVKLKCLRGVKDKLPGGRYVLIVSLYNRMGGHGMRWSKLKGQQWGGATLPIFHEGNFHNVEMKMDQSVFTVLPAKASLRPGMVLTFELFLLRGSVVSTDRVVAWGVFPICDGQFDIIEGKYKCPMLRGPMDMDIDKHEKIEELMASDLDHWLANLYFEVVKLPRYYARQKEYEVELQFSSGLTGHPDRLKAGWEDITIIIIIIIIIDCCCVSGTTRDRRSTRYYARQNEYEVELQFSSGLTGHPDRLKTGYYARQKEYEVELQFSSGLTGHPDRLKTGYYARQKEYEVELQFSSGLTGHPDRLKTGWEDNRDGEDPLPGSSSDLSSQPNSQAVSQVSLSSAVDSGHLSHRSASSARSADDKKGKFFGTTILSRVINRDSRKLKFDESSDEEEEMTHTDPQDVYAIRKERDFKPVPRMDGMFYKKYLNNPADAYYKRMFTLLPRTQLLAPEKKQHTLTHLEELEQHSFCVQPPFSGKGGLARKGREKLQYMARQFLAELGLSQWRSRQFWAMALMMIVVFWMRLYLHYVGQWVYLSASRIPINKFNFLPHTVELNYQPTLLETRQEIAVVILGPIMNIAVFSLLVVFAWICPKVAGLLPDIASQFIMAFGIGTFLDPLLVLVVDCALQRYEDTAIDPIADFTKLYWHFYRAQGSGVAGVFIPLFLYTCTAFVTASILYMYFLRLHNNGRMLDVFWRLHGETIHFFLPYDLEMSNQELSHVCRHAEQWRGEEGERRKVAIYDYVWEEEELDEDVWDTAHGEEVNDEERDRVKKRLRKEVTTHVSIHSLHLDGLRDLHRHFLRLPDGAVVEVFGDISIPGMDKDVKKALERGATNMQQLTKVSYRNKGGAMMGDSGRTSTGSSSSSSDSIPKKNL